MKKFACFLILFCLTFSLEAAPFDCQSLTGNWSGSYEDTQGLFPKEAFPVHLVLFYNPPMLYGYTTHSKDQTGARYGSDNPAYFWATCTPEHGVTNIHLISHLNVCGAAEKNPNLTFKNNLLSFNVIYENTMIDTMIYFSLQHDTIQNASINKEWKHRAQEMSQTPLHTCH